MTVLVTGAAGFLGTRLVRALLAGHSPFPATGRIVAADVAACAIEDPRVTARTGSVADPAFVDTLFAGGIDAVFHLAAVLSGQAETEFDTGMRINVDATRDLLEACRRQPRPPRFVFTSTIAVFGGALPAVIPEDLALRPQSSYGTEKAIGELLVADYSRRGFVEGVSCRVPTVAIRPGRPNSALSSFVSGIVREPLAGVDAVCPVPIDTRIWISAPSVVTRNLLHAATLSAAQLGAARSINLPGISVTPRLMLDSLERHAGPEARARVRVEPDERTSRIVCSWPGAFDVSRARGLGFQADRHVDDVVKEFMDEDARLVGS